MFAKLLAGYFVQEDATDGMPCRGPAIEDILSYATASQYAGRDNQEVAPKL